MASVWVSLVSSEFQTLFMPRGWKMCSTRKSMILAAYFFNDEAGDDVVGVGVLPLRAGFEVERFLAHVSMIYCGVEGFIIGVIR